MKYVQHNFYPPNLAFRTSILLPSISVLAPSFYPKNLPFRK